MQSINSMIYNSPQWQREERVHADLVRESEYAKNVYSFASSVNPYSEAAETEMDLVREMIKRGKSMMEENRKKHEKWKIQNQDEEDSYEASFLIDFLTAVIIEDFKYEGVSIKNYL